MRNQNDFKLHTAQPLQDNSENLPKQQCYGTTETWHQTLPWDCPGPGHSNKRAGIHWIFMAVKHESTLSFEPTRGTALKTRGESQLIIAIQAPWFSFISPTWLERHFSPQWTSKLTVTRLAASSYIFSLKIQRVIYAPHMQSKFRVQFRVASEETWAFSTQVHLLLHLGYYT